tara:strand:+ start:53 stop:652 length:600 start_codon:yes stop_codon:yes gene_type:complete
MEDKKIFQNCISLLANIFLEENSNEGKQTANFLLDADCSAINFIKDKNSNFYSKIFNSYSSKEEHPLVHEVRKISHLLPWYQTDMGGRITEQLKKQMIMTELVGPHSILYSSQYEIGIFLQLPNVAYPARRHPAEETFFTLSGKSFWQLDNNDEVERFVGDYINHPSMSSHSNRTTDSHLIACWRWSGDISLDSYNNLK